MKLQSKSKVTKLKTLSGTILEQFGHRFIDLAPKLKICIHMCGKKKKFFVNYDKWSEQSRNLHYEALKTLKMLWFPALCQWTLPDTLVHLDPTRRLTAFRAPKLHWQLALTRERSTPKLIF